jgi:hypothetical protein
MSRRLRSRLLPLALLLPVVLVLLSSVGLLWYDWITDVLVVRLAYTLWLAGLVIRSQPQALYWWLPIGVGVAAIFLVLARCLRDPRPASQPAPTMGRLAEWNDWLELAAVAPYFSRLLRRRVAVLAERALRLERYPPAENGDGLATVPMPNLPPEVEALLQERRSLPSDEIDGSQAEALQVIVDYLESALEVNHDW